MYTSSSRRQQENQGRCGGEEPFYYKPYAHLQPQARLARCDRGAGGRGPRCLQWCYRHGRRMFNKPDKSRESASFAATAASRLRFQISQAGDDAGSDGLGARKRRPGGGKDRDSDLSAAGNAGNDVSLREYWRDFMSQTSWHGCRLIVDPSKLLIIRILFFLIVLLTSCGLVNVALHLTQGVLDFKTVTRTMVFVDTDRRFPTVTICNMCPFSFRGKDASDPLFQILANASGFHSLFPAINTST
ncbi:hypothetical protein EGW08_017548 [Elysia chlorotica]|uniref:Uncharacterized protein n=1 Tax=Elysia chlorotica TaxID=188477 RepID=A0A3S1BTS9_ELYCH|nr:hypothetical protein EGW08_017548 [Elysia chlorotica]